MEITLHFAQSPNLTGATIAGVTGVDKYGWQYLWVAWKPDPADRSLPTVLGVYVNSPYGFGDFTVLDV
jgi:hypothetical protein